MKTYITLTFIALSTLFVAMLYPIDGYDTTGIKRLYRLQKMEMDSIANKRIPNGAYLKLDDIKLNLLSRKRDSLGAILVEDNDFARKIARITPGGNYSLAVLD
ncbi:MAG: hypothetical protein OSB51_08505, partial [Dokdonia donghaensis]|nr:hypothetical protein [Dokdonia donghaensis]